MEQPGRDPHAYTDGLTGQKTTHPQVPMFYYTVDEEIADLISVMNYCGIRTSQPGPLSLATALMQQITG